MGVSFTTPHVSNHLGHLHRWPPTRTQVAIWCFNFYLLAAKPRSEDSLRQTRASLAVQTANRETPTGQSYWGSTRTANHLWSTVWKMWGSTLNGPLHGIQRMGLSNWVLVGGPRWGGTGKPEQAFSLALLSRHDVANHMLLSVLVGGCGGDALRG